MQVVLNIHIFRFLPSSLQLFGIVIMSPSIKGCQPLVGFEEIKGKIILLERGECMFIDKVKTHFLVNRLTIQNEIFKVLKI